MSMDWEINIVKISTILKTIYGFSAIPVKIPAAFFTEMEKNNPQICMEPHTQKNKTQIAKSILRKNKAAGMTLPEFKLCCEGIAFKTVCYCHKTDP